MRIAFLCSWTFNSDLDSIFTLKATGCDFQHGAQFWCSLWSNLSVQMYHHLLARCTHDRPLNLWIVRILQCLSSWNTVRFQLYRNPASAQNLLNLSCCDNFSIRSPHLCNSNSSCAGSSLFKSTFLLITPGTNEELDCPLTTGLPVLSW